MGVSFYTDKTNYKAISEALQGLKTLKEQLQYFNDNCYLLVYKNANNWIEIKVKDFENSLNEFTVYCTCQNCKDLYSTNDFEVYRDFVNNQTDAIVKYFTETTDYKGKLDYYYKINGKRPEKTILTLKYVPNKADEVKEYYKHKEVKIDVTPQTAIEVDILLEYVKNKIINSDNDNITKPKRTLFDASREMYNPKSFIFENRVSEISNFIELIADETDRKELIKKYLDKINLDKIFTDEVKKNPYTSASHFIEVLKITDKIIQKNSFNNVIDKTKFRDIEHYLLALETIKLKKFLNSLNVPIPQQSIKNSNENKIWFKVGLLFATGEMTNLITDFNSNATQIAEHLKNKSYRPYITESISKTNNNDKNIFSNRTKMQSIIDYCSLHKVEVSTEFIKHLPTE